jgi:hypothetical protein
MYKNYNFGPLRFGPFASFVLLDNFDRSMSTWHATCVIIELKKIKIKITTDDLSSSDRLNGNNKCMLT